MFGDHCGKMIGKKEKEENSMTECSAIGYFIKHIRVVVIRSFPTVRFFTILKRVTRERI